MDTADIRGARAVVTHLLDGGQRWFRSPNAGKSWHNTLKVIGSPFNVLVVKGEVENGFLVGGAMAGQISKRNILLAPPSGHKSVVCLLGIRWDVQSSSSQMSLILHMYGESTSAGKSVWYRGYRLELGHSRSIHDYTHMQPVKSVGWPNKMVIPFEDASVPDRVPAFPVRGDKLTTLCAALAIGLHGSTMIQELNHLLRGNSTLGDVQSMLA